MSSDIDSTTVNNLTENECISPIDPQPHSSAPIKILLFPPNNKQLFFDENTKSIEIKPTETITEVVLSNNDIIQQDALTEPATLETGLTPLVDKCNLVNDFSNHLQSTPISETRKELHKTEINIKKVLKIENVFMNSKLKKHCFLKGCKWSSDGLCLLSNSEDNVLRLFEFSEHLLDNPQDVLPVLSMKEGGTVYDYEWYPHMNSSDPVSCVFACTSQDSPIHLWDAYTGQLRATYQPINQYDEVTSAYSLAFTPDGSRIYSGFKKCLRIFDITQPGRISEERNLKPKGNPVFQSNIISTICINPCMPTLYALGSYDKTIGIYTEPEGDLLCVLKGHSGGITQVKFSPDGNYLFSGGRKDREILCWDMRNPGKVVFSIQRTVDTQQKIHFDISPGQGYLITGTTDCNIKLFDIGTGSGDLIDSWRGHEDCVNGVQFHPNLPIFASSSGQRHVVPPSRDVDDDDDVTEEDLAVENSIKVWAMSQVETCT